MKKSILTAVAALALGAVSVQGQGIVTFQNFASGAVTAQGGGYAGAQFEVSLYWVSGTFAGTAAQLIATGTYYDASAPMFGAGGLTEANQDNGAGFFDGGSITIPGTGAGTFSFVAVAYSGATTYALALANPTSWAGSSSVFQANLVTGANPPNTTVIPTFQVAPVPEPSTFALAGLGLAGLLIFRRRK